MRGKGIVNMFLTLMEHGMIGVLLAMLCVELGNIVGRPMGMPIQGSVEITSYLGAIFVSICIFYTTLRHSNVVVRLVGSRLSGWPKIIMKAFGSLVGLVSVTVLAWAAGAFARKMSLEGERSLLLNLNIAYVRYVFVGGLVLVAIVLVVDFCETFGKGVKK